jgi:hypothetical protein
VIITKRCPHTGVLNFFVTADPLLAVGSVNRAPRTDTYIWRCYLDGQGAGTAADAAIAETNLRNAIARGRASYTSNLNPI